MEVIMNTNEVESRRPELEPEVPVWRRHQSAHLARHFSIAAFRQGERALSGLVAIPTTLALGTAAAAMFVAAILESGFDLVETSITDVGRRLSASDANGGSHPSRFVEASPGRA